MIEAADGYFAGALIASSRAIPIIGDGRRPDPATDRGPLWRVLPIPAADRAGELLAHRDCRSAVRPSLDPVSVEQLGIAQDPEAA
jgi:hypothetical protein